MPQVKNLVITCSRKVTANYSTREAGFTVTVELDEGENPRDVINAWTKRLQMGCDKAVGDPTGSTSFAHSTRYEPTFTDPKTAA